MPRARRSASNPPVYREPPNKQSVQQRTATTGVSSRVLVARQEYLFSADPEDPLVPSDRNSSSASGSGGRATVSATATGCPTLKPTSKRIGPLSTSSAAGLASAACLAAWWLDCFDSRASVSLPLVCGLASGCYALFAEDNSTQELQEDQDEPEREPMWTITQFDHFGALRFDNYLRFLVTKLAVVWRAIAALHKTATNYRFTVSISDKPSLSELQDLLEGRVPLMLTYDDVKQHPHGSDSDGHGKFSRSRVSSRASTAVTDDSSSYRESMDLSGLDMDMMRESFLEEQDKPEKLGAQKTEFQALEDQDDVTEYFTIEDTTDDCGWPSESESEASAVAAEEDGVEQEDAKPTSPKQFNATIAKALRSILVPVLPVEELAADHHAPPATASSSQLPGEPVVVPSVKPLIQDAKQADWHKNPARPEAAALLARARQPAPKRRIAVNVTPVKPLPRLVVKARPSTLTPPQNVQRMLDQVEKMMREVHELLAAGRDVLRSVETPGSADTENKEEQEKEEKKATGVSRPVRKAVSFSDEVCVLDATVSGLAAEEERELRTSLSYGPDEIESMSNDFFAELSLPSFD